MKTIKISLLALAAITTFTSCSNDDDAPVPVNEEEVITTLIATFTPQGGGTPIVLKSEDLDGNGPDAPIVTVSGDFIIDTTYNGAVAFFNELANPVENITEEVQEEGEEHQVFFQESGLGQFEYTDEDANGNPIGLSFVFTANSIASSQGSLTIILKHEPNKTADGVSDGDMTNAGGNTDAIATFNVNVSQ